MAKLDWDNLQLVEEYSPVALSSPLQEKTRLQTLASLILKVYRQQKLEEWELTKKRNEKIRRKAGVAV